MPDEAFKDMGIQPPSLAQRLRLFSSKTFQFVTEDGKDLQAELKLIEPRLRKNQYDAIITVEPVDGAWKITGLELLEEKRIDPYAKPKA